MESDEYQIITGEGEGLFKDRGSKFFGFAFPVNDEDEVRYWLEEVKSKHPKARHYCYAFRIGYSGELYRANDDGEPAGSAGKPILNTLLSEEVTNSLVVVVRYFGGTLLGVPGLINAYREAAKEAVNNTEKKICTINDKIKIEYDFDQTNVVMQAIKKYNLRVIEQTFNQRSGIVVEIRKTLTSIIKEELKEYWTISFEEII